MWMMLVAALLLVACGERPSAYYPTRAEAEAAGAFARGWLPSWLPPEATHIRETHDLDTNETCIRFDLAGEPRAAVLASMRALSQAEIETLPSPCSRLRPDWWFRNLIQQAPADDGALYGDVFIAPDTAAQRDLVVVADNLGAAVYVWRR